MATEREKSPLTGLQDAGCDVRVWSASCQHGEHTKEGDKYLCSSCGKIDHLDHEVRHEMFPHITGDYDNLS